MPGGVETVCVCGARLDRPWSQAADSSAIAKGSVGRRFNVARTSMNGSPEEIQASARRWHELVHGLRTQGNQPSPPREAEGQAARRDGNAMGLRRSGDLVQAHDLRLVELQFGDDRGKPRRNHPLCQYIYGVRCRMTRTIHKTTTPY